jgi:MoaA/NifB/PqqE/SkfB family radical SAM enzyme
LPQSSNPRPRIDCSETASRLPEQRFLPQAYHLPEGQPKAATVPGSPRVVFIETTNNCNLRCQTCPRTFFQREPPKTLTLAEFTRIVEQFPDMRRALLHGIGEPLLNSELPEMVKALKRRQVEVTVNSNGTLLSPDWQAALIGCGLDELRCSIDSPNEDTYARIRGANRLPQIVAGLAGLVKTKTQMGSGSPRLSIWSVATRENLTELPDLLRLAARIGVREVYVQRLVYFAGEPDKQFGMARDEQALFAQPNSLEVNALEACAELSRELGIDFRASGARDPLSSLAAARPAHCAPWSECLRPWTTAYVTANGNCLPCCIAPFATDCYAGLILGNVSELRFDEIWNGPIYQAFRTALLDRKSVV